MCDGDELLSVAQAEHLFTPADYETALLFVLGQCVVDTVTLEQIYTKLQASLEDRRLNLKMSRMTVIQGRPRLRDKVSSELKTDEKKTQVDTQLDTWDSYTGFCYKHQFPPTLSERVKSRLYFLASQTRWDWTKYVEHVLPSGGTVGEKVVAHPVTQPDLQVLLRVIERLSMDGSPPFEKMTEFRKECFLSFPVTHVQRMTLSQVRGECMVYERHDYAAEYEHRVDCYEFQFVDQEHVSLLRDCVARVFHRHALIHLLFSYGRSCNSTWQSGKTYGKIWWVSFPCRSFGMLRRLWQSTRSRMLTSCVL